MSVFPSLVRLIQACQPANISLTYGTVLLPVRLSAARTVSIRLSIGQLTRDYFSHAILLIPSSQFDSSSNVTHCGSGMVGVINVNNATEGYMAFRARAVRSHFLPRSADHTTHLASFPFCSSSSDRTQRDILSHCSSCSQAASHGFRDQQVSRYPYQLTCCVCAEASVSLTSQWLPSVRSLLRRYRLWPHGDDGRRGLHGPSVGDGRFLNISAKICCLSLYLFTYLTIHLSTTSTIIYDFL